MWQLNRKTRKRAGRSGADELLTGLAGRIVAARDRLVRALSRAEQKLSHRQKKVLLLAGATLGGLYFSYILAAGLLRPVMVPLPDYGPGMGGYPGLPPPVVMPAPPVTGDGHGAGTAKDSAAGPPPTLYDPSTQNF